MKLATTTGDFALYTNNYEKCVEYVCEAGFKYIDLSLYTASPADELLIRHDWKTCADKLKRCADKYNASFVQAHSPGGNPLNDDGTLLETTIRSIEVCGELGIKNTVFHSGVIPDIGKEEYFEKNKLFFEKLFPALEKNNVNLLCENSTKANMGKKFFPNNGTDLKEFVKYLNHPLIHACWDTGHANIEGSQYDEIMTLGDDLYAVHINDNRGERDEHLIPFFGTLNMDEIMNALLDSQFKGYFTFESSSSLRKSKYWLGNRRSFEKDTRLLEPQLFMQKHLEKLLYDTGVYILKTYNCYED